jgi:UDP-N-acetylglucosamine 2-epimerase (non-hydrolysing)
MSLSVVLVAGARPNFMKIAPVHRALREADGFDVTLVHTGQHYDPAMSDLFFRQLGIPEPDVNLGVGSASHAVQTAEIMKRFERLVVEGKPDLVVVVGDVNSTAACAMVAKKIAGVGVAHVEAGLRSQDRAMPEEINRLVTDALSDLHFTSEPSGNRHLAEEGVPAWCVRFVGNVMIDTLRAHLEKARSTGTLASLGLEERKFAAVTMHRPSNVDTAEVFDPLMDAIADVARRIPVVFPVHPRTRPALDRWSASRELPEGLRLENPLGYLEFLDLTSSSALVMTDSGGVQEETTALGVPCLTMRENTERPATVDVGTNVLVGPSADRLREAANAVLDGRAKKGEVPELWDGQAAGRIVAELESWDRRLR